MREQFLPHHSPGNHSHSHLPRRVYALTLGLLLVAGLFHSLDQAIPAHAANLPSVSRQAQPDESLELEGRLEPRQLAQLSVSLPARIDQVLVAEGEQVEAGAPVLRLDGYESIEAELAAAELDRLVAQQTLDDLYRLVDINLAEATLALRQAEKDQALAEDLLASLQRPHNQQFIDQAYANMLLAQERMAEIQEDYRKARQKYDNHKNPIWMFISRHRYKLLLTQMEKSVAYYERRYWDAKEKYEELLAPPEAVDLALAEASLVEAEARLRQAERTLEKWRNGPDPDALESAQAGLQATEARLASVQTAARNLELTAPFSGEVLAVDAKPGEWAMPGQTVVTIADHSHWVVITQDLSENSVTKLQVGMPVTMLVDAYPDLSLQGVVESISHYAEEEDGDVYYQAKIAVQDPPDFLRWGMTTRVKPVD
jgi:multidrug efflux pump subunit AcrA (membrane-fusion protein)